MLSEWLKELAKVQRWFRYRRLHLFLRREGHEVNHMRVFHIYREEQLHVRKRGRPKRATGRCAPMGYRLCQTTLVVGFCIGPAGRRPPRPLTSKPDSRN